MKILNNERNMEASLKCLIINYNRISLPVQLAHWCFNNGLEPVIIDNTGTNNRT
jgi:hypothetical protein